MTRIDFYANAGDKVDTACRLCAKAIPNRVRFLVYTEDAAADRKSTRLNSSHT